MDLKHWFLVLKCNFNFSSGQESIYCVAELLIFGLVRAILYYAVSFYSNF